MRQIFSRILFVALLFASCGVLFAQTQDVQPLPADPRVKTGTLANGLTYYIFKNDAVKGHADFAVAHAFFSLGDEKISWSICSKT